MEITMKHWLRDLPKAELHLHLEGTVSPETLVVLSARHDATPLTLAEARAMYVYTDFAHFLHTFKLVCDRLQTPEDYALIAHEMMLSLAAQGVVHAEVYIAWGNILVRKPHLRVEDVMQAVDATRIEFEKEHRAPSVLWIADANRHWGPDHIGQVFRLAAGLRVRFPSIVGVGIGGDEVSGPVASFRKEYVEAKEAGLRLTAHAGEATGKIQGPLEIRAALEMGVERIGHGVAAQYDAELVEILAQRGVPVEINVTSNLLTGSCSSLHEHPLPGYLKSGVLCNLNSDDPAMFGSNCLEEYILVQKTFGIDPAGMKVLARNSINATFLGHEKQTELLQMIDSYPGLAQ
jgi:aminodeoxyfutalosine deaminase